MVRENGVAIAVAGGKGVIVLVVTGARTLLRQPEGCHLPVEALQGPQVEPRKMRDSFLARRDLIVGLLNRVPGVSCKLPGGAFYAWPNVTEACRMIGAADSEEFRKRLLNEAGVALLADIHFGARVPGEGQHVRFSYAASNEAIERGVARMAEFIRKNTKKAA